MKCEHPSLYAALLVGVLVNVLLRSQTAYWCRAGAAAALVCAPVLAAVGALFAVSWRQGATPLLRLLFALLLAGTSVLELLRLWNLTQRLYPGAVTQLALCLLVLLPILYLRRVSAISQTAYVVLCLLCIATAGMLLSVFPRLQITNLQNAALTWPDFADAARDQLTLYPDYLALYFYAMTRLLGGEARQENAAANLGPFCVYLLLLPTVCLLLRGLDVDAALRWRSAFTWGFVLLVWIGGAAAWLCRKFRRCS